jgi:hypothetical protein
MKEGDILLVTKLDRLARSLRDIVNVLHTITQEKKAHFKVTTIADPLYATRKSAEVGQSDLGYGAGLRLGGLLFMKSMKARSGAGR